MTKKKLWSTQDIGRNTFIWQVAAFLFVGQKRPPPDRLLVSSDPQAPVARETAAFAIRVVLVRIQDHEGHRAEINFRNDPVTLSDLFAMLEKFSGASGWREMQRLSGYTAHEMSSSRSLRP